MNSHKKIILGAHLRFRDSFTQILADADSLNFPVFQFFLATAIKKKSVYIQPTIEEKAFLRRIVTKNNILAIAHASYWINAASWRDEAYLISKSLIKKEINLATELEIPYLVLHPGTANGLDPALPTTQVRQLGIERLAAFLNEVLAEQSITILLENTAHGRNAIGSDLKDFHRIKALLNRPDQVHFCLDTAHAFAYGYDLTNFSQFLETLNQEVGHENLRLIHLNDVEGACGNKQDRHTLPGEGQLGLALIKKIAFFDAFSHIPKIMELPSSSVEIIRQVTDQVISNNE